MAAEVILIHTKREARDEPLNQVDIQSRIILIHTKREARDGNDKMIRYDLRILIHTKREARDFGQRFLFCEPGDFNPHEARSS